MRNELPKYFWQGIFFSYFLLNDFLLNPYEILIKEKNEIVALKAKTYSGQTENDTI